MRTIAVMAMMLTPAIPAPATTVGRAPGLVARQIVVTTNGARSDGVSSDETAAFCARFRLSAAEVRRYFAAAHRVDSRAHNHDLDMSRCYAGGTARFANGWRGSWTIDLARRGALRLADGRYLFFYCVDCTSTKFEPLDDEGRAFGRAVIRGSRLTG